MFAFLGNLWNKTINPFIGLAWHAIGGAIMGTIAPTLVQSLVSGQFTKVGAISTIVSGITGVIVGLAQHSNNQTVAQLANTLTPAQVADVNQKIVDKVDSLTGGKK